MSPTSPASAVYASIEKSSWIVVALGILLAITPFLAEAETGAQWWNVSVVASLVVALALANAWTASQRRLGMMRASALLIVALCLWAPIHAWGTEAPPAFATGVTLLGGLAALVAAWDARTLGRLAENPRRLQGEAPSETWGTDPRDPMTPSTPKKVHLGIEASSWIALAAGAALVAIPFVAERETGVQWWNAIAAGALVVLLAGFDAWAAATGRAGSAMWPSVLVIALGLWVGLFSWGTNAPAGYLFAATAAGLVAVAAAGYDVWASARVAEPPDQRRPSL